MARLSDRDREIHHVLGGIQRTASQIPRFARFRNDMLEHAASEQHEEKELSQPAGNSEPDQYF